MRGRLTTYVGSLKNITVPSDRSHSLAVINATSAYVEQDLCREGVFAGQQ
jgi:hypothetical protein